MIYMEVLGKKNTGLAAQMRLSFIEIKGDF
jgi:hypothetical protein